RLQAKTVGLVGRLREQSASERDFYGKRLALYRAVVESSNDAIITKSLDGIITGWNRAAERLFGYSEAEVVGANVEILMPPSDAARHDRYIAHYRETRERRIIGIGRIVVGQRRDGTEFPMKLSVGEANSDGHRIFTGFIHDLTEQ
ncbi:PAS domain S-box protein, partial [Pseudomonas proteolytica]|uniref:PAS domain S-box protein n=1 Tax=Pseudomonas proteolytica TaxID=219574 RepID=UPI0030DA3641